jgi:hypothetical protein
VNRPSTWFAAGAAIATVALALLTPQWLRRPAEAPGNAAEMAAMDAMASPAAQDTGHLEPAAAQARYVRAELTVDQATGLGASLLADSPATRHHLFGLTVRDAGFPCPQVRSAAPLSPQGIAWRVHCGEALLYWIEVDEFGRLSVEPGNYSEPGMEPGVRTITIEPGER